MVKSNRLSKGSNKKDQTLEITITLSPDVDRVATLGAAERNLKLIREALNLAISARGDTVRISGDSRSVNHAAEIIADLTEAARRKRPLERMDLVDMLRRVSPAAKNASITWTDNALEVYVHGERIYPKTPGQRAYLEGIYSSDMIFCCGPAGTGKTYLAVAAAVSLLKQGKVRKLVLVRPAVEAGEKLGFLPGDMQQKVNPYLRPLLDGLHDMMPYEQVERFMHNDVVEVIPLAFMRGRTLNDAVVILDEAQNATKSQMMMFLTRLGHGSKMIVTGDTSQTDLPDKTQSGLVDAVRRLKNVPGISFVTLAQEDIVRHNLVQRIVDAYGENKSDN